MEVDSVILALAIHGRIFCGLDAEEAVIVAEKTVSLANETKEVEDIVDLLDLFDDVWAASLKAGTIHEENTTPIHPLDEYTHVLNAAADEAAAEVIHETYANFKDTVKRPKRYNNPKYVAVKSKKKNRRKWDKGGE